MFVSLTMAFLTGFVVLAPIGMALLVAQGGLTRDEPDVASASEPEPLTTSGAGAT